MPDLKQPSVLRRCPRIGEAVLVYNGYQLGTICQIFLAVTGVIGFDPGSERWQVEISPDNRAQAVMVTERVISTKASGKSWAMKQDSGGDSVSPA